MLVAIRDLTFKGGNTKTGAALDFLMESVFSQSMTRENTPKVGYTSERCRVITFAPCFVPFAVKDVSVQEWETCHFWASNF